jgi:hypothetical protein
LRTHKARSSATCIRSIGNRAGKEKSLTNALPVDVALGKVDYIEVVGFRITRRRLRSGIDC